MRKEFLVERQGRTFALYAGLLDMAHQQGLKSIRTDLLQIPRDENDKIAISMATVTLEKDGRELVFTAIGDASARNVAPAMVTCLIRMAETRAKARALRDAVNVGVVAFEELGNSGDDVEEYAPAPRQRAPQRPAVPPVQKPATDENGAILEGQKNAIRVLSKDLGEDVPANLDSMTDFQARLCIKGLNDKKRERRVA